MHWWRLVVIGMFVAPDYGIHRATGEVPGPHVNPSETEMIRNLRTTTAVLGDTSPALDDACRGNLAATSSSYVVVGNPVVEQMDIGLVIVDVNHEMY